MGAISVLTAYPALFTIIKYAGAAYLTFIGIKLLHGAYLTWQRKGDGTYEVKTIKKSSANKAFKKALFVSFLNPKVILFLLSFFVQFVDPTYNNPVLPFFILAITLQTFSIIYLAVLIYAGSKLAAAFKSRKRITALSSGAVGTGFIAFAVKLSLASA